MSPQGLSNGLDLFGLRKQLEQGGWDAFASDLVGEVAARREQLPGRGVWSLVIDRSGRWRFTATHGANLAAGLELLRGGHTFHLSKEKQQVLTIAGRLRHADDLPAVLAELTQLALEETDQPSYEAEEELTWHENHALQAELSPS